MVEIIKALPANLLVGLLALLAILLFLVPISLRIAGLTGQQIIDVLTMTTKFVVELVSEFRSENSAKQ